MFNGERLNVPPLRTTGCRSHILTSAQYYAEVLGSKSGKTNRKHLDRKRKTIFIFIWHEYLSKNSMKIWKKIQE